jgi:hypothetical protein
MKDDDSFWADKRYQHVPILHQTAAREQEAQAAAG